MIDKKSISLLEADALLSPPLSLSLSIRLHPPTLFSLSLTHTSSHTRDEGPINAHYKCMYHAVVFSFFSFSQGKRASKMDSLFTKENRSRINSASPSLDTCIDLIFFPLFLKQFSRLLFSSAWHHKSLARSLIQIRIYAHTHTHTRLDEIYGCDYECLWKGAAPKKSGALIKGWDGMKDEWCLSWDAEPSQYW